MGKTAGTWGSTQVHIVLRFRINMYSHISTPLHSRGLYREWDNINLCIFYFPTWSMATANDFQFDLLALTIFGHECKL